MADRTQQRVHPLLALGAFASTVVGVGIFALPYAASQSGLLPLVAVFLVLAPLVMIIHERFANVVAGTPGARHRIPGYVGLYLGHRLRRVGIVVSSLSLLGAAIAFIIVGSTFLQLLLSPVMTIALPFAALLFVLAGGLLVARGERSVSGVDLLSLVVVLGMAVPIVEAAASRLNLDHLVRVQWSALPLSYGLILFSLWGLATVPEMVDLAGGNRRNIRRIVHWGLAGITVLYLVFTAAVLGVTGPATTQDAITGFLGVAGNHLTVPFAIFGLLTTFTSYVTLLLTLTQTLRFDLRIVSHGAYLLALLIPFLLFLAGLNDVVAVLGVTGAIFVGAEGALVLWVADVFRRKQSGGTRLRPTTILLLFVLALGVVVEVWSFVRAH